MIVRFTEGGKARAGYVTGKDPKTGQLRICTAPGQYTWADPDNVEVVR